MCGHTRKPPLRLQRHLTQTLLELHRSRPWEQQAHACEDSCLNWVFGHSGTCGELQMGLPADASDTTTSWTAASRPPSGAAGTWYRKPLPLDLAALTGLPDTVLSEEAPALLRGDPGRLWVASASPISLSSCGTASSAGGMQPAQSARGLSVVRQHITDEV